MLKIETIQLEDFIQQQLANNDPFTLLNGLFSWLKEEKNSADRLVLLREKLAENPELGEQVALLVGRWLCEIRLYPLLISGGILPREGFARELKNRLYEKINPSPKDPNDLRDAFFRFFSAENDGKWLQQTSIRQWYLLIKLLGGYLPLADRERLRSHLYNEGLFAVEMLAIWVAAEELEPELMRLDPSLLNAESPFVALQREVALWVNAQRKRTPFDDSHLQVMFDQCQTQIQRLHKKGTTAGSSLNVAYLLERLQQTLDRLAELMEIFANKRLKTSKILQLTRTFAVASAEQHHITPLWKQSAKMLSRSITQNTSDHGEHYISRDKKEYFSMFFSAAGGGVLIALMALFKIYLGGVIDDKVWKGVAEGLNYGIGFTLIFMLHCTVATKQPAMTAARFAEAVERNPQGRAVDMKLAQLLMDVLRSQMVAVLGNVLMAIGVAALIAMFYVRFTAQPLLDQATIDYQLASINPFGGTLWFAAIAGLWLFCSGIISGFFDNRSNYLNLRQRLREHPLLKRLMGEATRTKFADYFHDNYGSIMGNLCFGLLLGLTGVVGYLTGLPLDIRHVAFSSANVGYAVVSGSLGWGIFWQSVVFVLLIGVVNLIVSFSLTLWVALRSLDTEIDSWKNIFKCVGEIAKKRPLSLFFPVENK
ncbi:recombinase [Haemophilus paracuniculus]|uniref:Recombinase n=1 Tax=Haemophilus paracuniculus TaxID=734 RepID=A0A1T0AQU0_9PAST|nr:recombinase [Haemophilus paracuniculus]OOR98399.1 recombinase [Haemophilus paracuniculus]